MLTWKIDRGSCLLGDSGFVLLFSFLFPGIPLRTYCCRLSSVSSRGAMPDLGMLSGWCVVVVFWGPVSKVKRGFSSWVRAAVWFGLSVLG